MSFIIVGLGNPGFEYEGTRHNAGRVLLEKIRKHFEFSDWKLDKKFNAQTATGAIGKEKVLLMMPEGFMNNSGKSLKHLAGSPKKAEKCLVIYDELDMPLGSFKISFGRGDGGHNGLASVIKCMKTRDFPRIRVGITPATPSGKLKKPSGEKDVIKHILGKFKPAEEEVLKKESKKILEAVETLLNEGRAVAMNQFN
jgi:PTH1 family peptidyl-tRNA hydrolase